MRISGSTKTILWVLGSLIIFATVALIIAQGRSTGEQKALDSGPNSWQTYTDDKISFEYPTGWSVRQDRDQSSSTTRITLVDPNLSVLYEGSEVDPIHLSYRPDIYNSKLDQYITHPAMLEIVKPDRQSVAGYEAYVFQGTTPPIPHDFRVMFAKKMVFSFSNNSAFVRASHGEEAAAKVDIVFEHILSSVTLR